MATLLRVVVLLCTAAAVFALDVNDNSVDGTEALSHNVKKREERNQSVIYGIHQPNDKLLYYEYVDMKGSLSEVKMKNITYPPESSTNKLKKVTCIYVWDNLRTGENARFSIDVVKDDMGRKFAKINMKGKPGKPIKYEVYIYGFEN